MNDLEFKELVRKEREKNFVKPYDLAYNSFLNLKLDLQDKNYFLNNASQIIHDMRIKSWENFLKAEDNFSKSIYDILNNFETYDGLTNYESVKKFINTNIDKFYILSLSNTQSRRSRTGTEFETIVELVLMGAGLLLDSQGCLSSGIFQEHNLGKSVDIVCPSVMEYEVQKRQCSLISCKTSLRERWAEVIEEKERTGAAEVYLITLDEKMSKSTLKLLNDKNVIPVVTKKIKKEKYGDCNNVITFEEMLNCLIEKNKYWTIEKYSSNQKEIKKKLINAQMNYHFSQNHIYVKKFYENQLDKFKE
ncbi:type II restriction endonuclease [Longibaculum muris]|uniref:type II restriction endonuclease n=1 Tax=Longibaculum muris TaxID=1796628 RepID=UPI0022E35E7C|nr:type II restriction endonuclease [Longibaculum muris]